ncbi:MAG: hypothetical protein CMN32_02140 [Saprospirales bacterium]|jgi:hypothetical protein|nr:hypothetical protein [Saprospirales bacterium]
MKIFTALLVCTLMSTYSFAQNYNFNGTISREVLDNYLDRAITMQALSDIQGAGLQPESERIRDINMLDDINAKFIGRMAGWWESGWGQTNHDNFFNKVQQNVSDIKANDPQVICQASIFEYVSGTIESFWIPNYVWNEFGISPPKNHRLDYESMLYPAPASQYMIYERPMTEGERQWIPDITQTATQMWIYYMATRYISVGCEAIHFGQAEIMNRRDIGNKEYWKLLDRIRNYATSRNRGVVLCDAHVPSGGMYYEPSLNMTIESWQNYNYPQGWDKQLLWDFHSIWVGYEETSECTPTLQPVIVNPHPDKGLHQRSLGGLHPQGWYTVSNSYLVELDNGGIGTQVGCKGTPDWFLYGWDEISWFASQPEYYRNEVLKYTYYKIKCMDMNGHLNMPGRRKIILTPGGPINYYRANTGNFNQQSTIKSIWNGQFPSPTDWVRKDFSDDFVSNSPQPGIAKKSLIFLGNNRMYYIGKDNRIHGYIKHSNIWLTVSPSYAAGNVSSQEQAAGDLIANPSGTYLYYRGTNGLIYRFKINSDWSYTYSAMPTNTAMKQQNITAVGSLICPSDNRLYYIANESSNGNAKRIHGFIKSGSSWITTSPTHIAGNVSSQEQAAGDLIANPSGTYLYYRGTNGFIYRFKINSDWSYTYSAMPTNIAMKQQNITAVGALTCPSDNRLYYIANESSNGNAKRIHGFIKFDSFWTTVSPSWSAHANGQNINSQQTANNQLACSPDNQTISYLGTDNELHGFKIASDWDYTYFNFKHTPSNKKPRESLAFNQDNKLFYIASISGDNKVHFFEYGECHCENQAVQDVEPNCCMYLTNNQNDIYYQQAAESNWGAPNNKEFTHHDFYIELYPNPSGLSKVNLEINGVNDDSTIQVTILDMQGKIYSERIIDFGHFPTSLNVQNLPNGIYTVHVKTDHSTKVVKLIISK